MPPATLSDSPVIIEAPVIIEVAVNGATPKSRNPHVPRSVDEIVIDAVACIDAGASIVHNHNDDPVLGTVPTHDPQPYIDAWRAILAQRPGTILYPTMGGGGPHTTIEQRYSHIPALAEAGVLGQGLVDPGCVAFGGTDPDGLPADADIVYRNTNNGKYWVAYKDGVQNVPGGGGYINAGAPWQYTSVGDFDGDGDGDVTWYNTDLFRYQLSLLDGHTQEFIGWLREADADWVLLH